jgi:uncharacterized protein YndB with AHSA1/START domain/dihydrofolate reductase
MRKVIFQMLISLDGFFEGLNREIDWHNVDEEFNEFANDFLNSVDTLLFGRVTYEMMAAFWPSEKAITTDPIIAAHMNSLQKIVFSKTLRKADWDNTKIVSYNIPEEVMKLKKQPGKHIAIFGSSDLAVSLMDKDLIDEFRVMVNPVVLGSGKRLFEGIKKRYVLKLLKTKVFKSGNVLLYYEPKKNHISGRELTITRVINAPREVVWRAWTEADLLKMWWGPRLFTNPVCEVDVRAGGAIRIHMRGPDGVIYPMTGVYDEVTKHKRLVFTSAALDEKGNPLFEVLNTIIFEEIDGKTKLITRASVSNESAQAKPYLDGMKEGWTQSLERLAEFVVKPQSK